MAFIPFTLVEMSYLIYFSPYKLAIYNINKMRIHICGLSLSISILVIQQVLAPLASFPAAYTSHKLCIYPIYMLCVSLVCILYGHGNIYILMFMHYIYIYTIFPVFLLHHHIVFSLFELFIFINIYHINT